MVQTGSDTVQTGSDTVQTLQTGSDTVQARFRLVQAWFRHGSDTAWNGFSDTVHTGSDWFKHASGTV